MHPTAVPDVDPYPTEMPKIRAAFAKLSKRFANTKLTDQTIDQFHRAAIDLFAEAGFTVDVAWDQVYSDGAPTGLFMPELTLAGRVRKESETDHDRIQYEVQEGLADGVKGVIRADGTKTEDPISKTIV